MDLPLLSVTFSKDGLWTVNERGPSRVAIAYFPSKLGAMRHAVRVARGKRRCRVAVLDPGGRARLSHDYESDPQTPEVP